MDKYSNLSVCPKCQTGCLQEIGECSGESGIGKYVLGALIGGVVGLLACRSLNKKKIKYQCDCCGHTVEKYDKHLIIKYVCLILVINIIFLTCFSYFNASLSGKNRSHSSNKTWSNMSEQEKNNARWAYDAKQAIDD